MEWKFKIVLFLLILGQSVLCAKHSSSAKCEKNSLTTTSGSKASTGPFCPGDLIFEDTFDTFDLDIWKHENTLSGGGNWEFQWYTNNRTNSFSDNGILSIKPTLTSDEFGETFLNSGVLNIHGSGPAEECTNQAHFGCERVGTNVHIINPIKSARIRTAESFAFKYGKVEISAKVPSGDWLWPAISFFPKSNYYGSWPASGEIDLLAARGNAELLEKGLNVGVEQIESTLHFGPNSAHNGYKTSIFARSSEAGKGFNTGFSRYQMEWTPEKITFSVNDIETGTVKASPGFWQRGDFNTTSPGLDNPWRFGGLMAPFDQQFFIVINVAVGGNSYFPDDSINKFGKKPWKNDSPHAVTEFWDGKNSWLPTWNAEVDSSTFQIDYVRVWSL